jgi:hypothetical protein
VHGAEIALTASKAVCFYRIKEIAFTASKAVCGACKHGEWCTQHRRPCSSGVRSIAAASARSLTGHAHSLREGETWIGK